MHASIAGMGKAEVELALRVEWGTHECDGAGEDAYVVLDCDGLIFPAVLMPYSPLFILHACVRACVRCRSWLRLRLRLHVQGVRRRRPLWGRGLGDTRFMCF